MNWFIDHLLLFLLKPRDSSQLFDSLELSFNKLDNFQPLTKMVIRDASGQITDISFSDVRHNPKLKQNLFTFEIPQGVDVIDGRQGHY